MNGSINLTLTENNIRVLASGGTVGPLTIGGVVMMIGLHPSGMAVIKDRLPPAPMPTFNTDSGVPPRTPLATE